MTDIYDQLAKFLDQLPASYPSTDSGVELRILHKLFSPEEAETCLQLSLLPEPAHVVAYRLHQPVEKVACRLAEMDRKGLISGHHSPGRPDEYSASQFAIGFWEDQVDHVDRELAELFEAYLPVVSTQGSWPIVPQLRTIPVGVSIPVHSPVMAYEKAEAILRKHSAFAVRNCICRQQQQVLGKGCGKPMETCLTLGGTAHAAVRSGRSRYIPLDEALKILDLADQASLVIQPSNSQDPVAICFCCGCCCGALRGLKLHENPADMEASAYIAELNSDLCSACGTCETRCQMDAIHQGALTTELNANRCIGCGLCVSTCPNGAINLVRKPPARQPGIPANTTMTYLSLGQKRGTFGYRQAVGTLVRSRWHRLVAPRK